MISPSCPALEQQSPADPVRGTNLPSEQVILLRPYLVGPMPTRVYESFPRELLLLDPLRHESTDTLLQCREPQSDSTINFPVVALVDNRRLDLGPSSWPRHGRV